MKLIITRPVVLTGAGGMRSFVPGLTVEVDAAAAEQILAQQAGIAAWFSQRPPSTLYLSVLTLGEIRKGLEGVSDEARRQTLLDWLETDLPTFFTGRVLPVDAAVADRWGRLVAAVGRPLPAMAVVIPCRSGRAPLPRPATSSASSARVRSAAGEVCDEQSFQVITRERRRIRGRSATCVARHCSWVGWPPSPGTRARWRAGWLCALYGSSSPCAD